MSLESGRGPPGNRPSGTIIICTRERGELLADAVCAIAADAGDDPRAEILIVEQGVPFAAEVCARLGVRARIIRDDGAGASRARNRAAREAQAPLLLFVDDDCNVEPGWFASHVEAFANPTVAATFGHVAGLASLDVAAEDPPTKTFDVAVRLGTRVAQDERAPWTVGHSANMAVRRQVFLELGGFDERLGAGTRAVGGEDADLIVRLLLRGATVLTDVGPSVQHADWRADSERRHTLFGYERGAGAWIGKAIRNEGRAALPYFRTRLVYLWNRSRDDLLHRKDPVGAARAIAAFVRGLLLGLRLAQR